jgi:hypothetical protein
MQLNLLIYSAPRAWEGIIFRYRINCVTKRRPIVTTSSHMATNLLSYRTPTNNSKSRYQRGNNNIIDKAYAKIRGVLISP